MRILVVSYVFPPHNIIGAVRVGKTAKFLHRFGHDLRVLAADALPLPRTLELEVPREHVIYTDWVDVDTPYRVLLSSRDWIKSRLRRAPVEFQGVDGDSAGSRSRGAVRNGGGLGKLMRLLYTDLVHLPDYAAGWYKPACKAGQLLFRGWRPDVIIASGAPWTSFLVARDLATYARVPWVADFRDLWAENPDLSRSFARAKLIDEPWERRAVASASALVTVTEPLADILRERYPGKPVSVVLNGFDPEDYEGEAQASTPAASARNGAALTLGREDALRLVYTGQINRSVLPLLDALALLGPTASQVQVHFVGVANEAVRASCIRAAEERGVDGCLTWMPAMPHAKAARYQQRADVLFLLLHQTPNDARVYTGKLFEYVGAQRPILIVGLAHGAAADLVRDRRIGAAEAEPSKIADRLLRWLQEKRETGRTALLDARSTTDLTRESQTGVLADVLASAARCPAKESVSPLRPRICGSDRCNG